MKRVKNQTMNDLLLEHQAEDNVQDKGFNEASEMLVQDDRYNEKLVAYNKTVATLDKDFTKLKPRLKVLIRCEVKELQEDENGVLQINTTMVAQPTRAGVGFIGTMENPYPYSRKAYVVAVPEHFGAIPGLKSLVPGQRIILSSNPVQAVATGHGDNAQINIKDAFIHPDFDEMGIPQDPQAKNFGYLLVDTSKIDFTR